MINLRPLTLADRKSIQNFVNNFEPYSDFNFVSLYSWALGDQTKFYLDGDDALFVAMPDYVTGQPSFTLLIKRRYDSHLAAFLAWLDEHKLPRKFVLVPEVMRSDLEAALHKLSLAYTISNDRGAYDYILDVDKTVSLQGGQYADMRYKLGKFGREWGHQVRAVTFDPGDDTDVQKVVKLTETWAAHKNIKGNEYEHEVEALNRFLTAGAKLPDIHFQAYELAGKLVAFSSWEVISTEYALGHFLKYDPSIQNMYYKLVHDSCFNLLTRGVSYLNIEQDLDIESLRNTKMHLRPAHFLEKFTLEVTSPA